MPPPKKNTAPDSWRGWGGCQAIGAPQSQCLALSGRPKVANPTEVHWFLSGNRSRSLDFVPCAFLTGAWSGTTNQPARRHSAACVGRASAACSRPACTAATSARSIWMTGRMTRRCYPSARACVAVHAASLARRRYPIGSDGQTHYRAAHGDDVVGGAASLTIACDGWRNWPRR
jgi:hypothetical protein